MGDDEGEWDFYPCQVDGAPASIFLNLAYREVRPDDRDTLYFAGLQILEPGEHGMGTGSDVDLLHAAEGAITKAAAGAGFTYVGRLRNGGDWQLTFYGQADKEAQLEQIVAGARGERGYRIGSKLDASWSYFDDFLMPDPERWQWITDRRLVARLSEAGDHHATPRPVDHYVYFADASGSAAFAAAAIEHGFGAEKDDGGSGDEPYCVHLVRTDSVDVGHIHDVVMLLTGLADEHGGNYDGWGAPVAKASPGG